MADVRQTRHPSDGRDSGDGSELLDDDVDHFDHVVVVAPRRAGPSRCAAGIGRGPGPARQRRPGFSLDGLDPARRRVGRVQGTELRARGAETRVPLPRLAWRKRVTRTGVQLASLKAARRKRRPTPSYEFRCTVCPYCDRSGRPSARLGCPECILVGPNRRLTGTHVDR